MIYTVIGSGFGLYGYLPALLANRDSFVVLPSAYKSKIENRSELLKFVELVQWKSSQEECLEMADGIVLATTPWVQSSIIKNINNEINEKKLILEKPLGISPNDSKCVLQLADLSRCAYRVNYSFVYCSWFPILQKFIKINSSGLFVLNWEFKAYHFLNYTDNWKRRHERGGGVLRFYGIHVIAMLSKLGYKNVLNSYIETNFQGDWVNWFATFYSPYLPDFKVNLLSSEDWKVFDISIGGKNPKDNCIVQLVDPFSSEDSSFGQDSRVAVISKLINSLLISDDMHAGWYQSTNDLWQSVEDVTQVGP